MLITSAKAGNLDYVKLAIAQGANINAKDDKGGTALHWAVYYNHKEIVKFLLMQGANPFEVDNQGVSPIDVARMNNKKEILKIFEEYLKKKEGK
jgi:ankyrin repeat protein